MDEGLVRRFRAGFTEGAPDECWPWQRNTMGKGYGKLRLTRQRREIGAHRVALSLALGRELSPGEEALHTCDNPPCVNPAHLYSGDQRRNTADAIERGRLVVWHCPRGHLRCRVHGLTSARRAPRTRT